MLLHVAGPAIWIFSIVRLVSASSPQCSADIAAQGPRGEALMQVSKRQIPVESSLSQVVRSNSDIAGQLASNSSVEQPPKGDLAITVSGIKCNEPIYSPDGICPLECPYYAQENGKKRACYFRCVRAEQCGTADGLDPHDDIADEELFICRSCKVIGCEEGGCEKGKGDRCGKCMSGYSLNLDDGSCTSDYWRVWSGIFIFAGIVITLLLVWLGRLFWLPVTNKEGLKEGLSYRSSLKLRVPKVLAVLVGADPDDDRPLWPLTTSLHGVQVAGPGLTLHMNFQFALIIWGCLVIVVWVLYAYFTSPDMLVLGLWPADTPQQVCSVTLRGKELQRRLLPTKLIFMVVMFLATFGFNFAYSLWQRYRFLQLDDDTSMTDFAALCMGLPELSGEEKVEDLVKACIEEKTQEKVVGVSVCWDYKDKEEEVDAAIDDDIDMLADYDPPPTQEEVDGMKPGMGQKLFGHIDSLFGFTGKVQEAVSETEDKIDVEKMLKEISNTDSAFIVFESEASRDKAVKMSLEGEGFSFRDSTLYLTQDEAIEPDTVKWANFAVGNFQFFTKIGIGILAIFFALLIWAFGFYLPFAAYQASFAQQGEEPGFLAAFVFSMLVVAGNQIMYFICAEIADRVGFRFNDHQEAFYIALYTLACTLNLIVDMYMEYYLAYKAAVASHVHTADGQLLEDMLGFQEVFESYPMQKAVGTRLFAYCFPATFFIPFLMEPIFAIILPFYVCKLLLRTHPECRGRDAEKSLDFFAPMDMGRYGDLLLNLWLSVLIVFFPPGTFLKMMLALVVSHVFVYVYDQYRILRSVPSFDYSSDYIDRLVQILMGFATAFLAAGIVFKGGCLDGSPVCFKEKSLVYAMGLAFVVTMLFHTFMIKHIVPMFDHVIHKEHQVSETPYEEAAANTSSTWFSENKMHCLRSKYIYKHEPPCIFNMRGKEHLIKPNPACGVYFQCEKKVDAKEYGED